MIVSEVRPDHGRPLDWGLCCCDSTFYRVNAVPLGVRTIPVGPQQQRSWQPAGIANPVAAAASIGLYQLCFEKTMQGGRIAAKSGDDFLQMNHPTAEVSAYIRLYEEFRNERGQNFLNRLRSSIADGGEGEIRGAEIRAKRKIIFETREQLEKRKRLEADEGEGGDEHFQKQTKDLERTLKEAEDFVAKQTNARNAHYRDIRSAGLGALGTAVVGGGYTLAQSGAAASSLPTVAGLATVAGVATTAVVMSGVIIAAKAAQSISNQLFTSMDQRQIDAEKQALIVFSERRNFSMRVHTHPMSPLVVVADVINDKGECLTAAVYRHHEGVMQRVMNLDAKYQSAGMDAKDGTLMTIIGVRGPDVFVSHQFGMEYFHYTPNGSFRRFLLFKRAPTTTTKYFVQEGSPFRMLSLQTLSGLQRKLEVSEFTQPGVSTPTQGPAAAPAVPPSPPLSVAPQSSTAPVA